ncbi:hypothetical protein BLGI_2394 [Brevibacillus laterosporus GI-9]|nr:hypothetical protein BLGI_2394 [Brevibacillus laterosporus GI-9]
MEFMVIGPVSLRKKRHLCDKLVCSASFSAYSRFFDKQ